MNMNMIRGKSTITVVVGFLLLFAGALCALGQQETRAAIGGRVIDPKGAVIQKATVVVTSDATGVNQTTETTKTGDWIVKFLTPGLYHFEVSAPGFKRELRSSIELQVADQKFIETRMQVGADTQSVTVEATTPLIDTTSAVSGTVVTSTELDELQTQSNSPTMMVSLTPGVTISGGVGGTGIYLWSNGGLSGTVVNNAGSGSGAINYAVDGGNVSNNAGNLAFEPPMDSVSEFRLVTNAYDAAIGRQSSSTINVAMKSGTEKLHGDLYEDNQNNFLNANSYQNDHSHQAKAPIHLNQYGGGVGGPVWIPKLYNGRNRKTFFYYTFAGIRNINPGTTGYMSMPTMLERTGDFSQSYTTTTTAGVKTTYPYKIYDPNTWNYDGKGDRQEFTNNVIPSGRVDGIATALLKLMPPPDNAGDGANSDSNNFNMRAEQNDKFAGNTLRFDHSWNENNHTYVDLRKNDWTELSYDVFGPTDTNGLLLQGLYQARYNKGITIDHALTLTPRLLVDLRYTVTAWDGSSYDPAAGVSPTTVGFSAAYAALAQDPSIPEFTGIGSGYQNGGLGTSQANSYTNDTNQDFNVGITQTLKNHSFRYGWEYLVQQEGSGGLGASSGVFAFGTNWTTKNPDGTAGTGEGNDTADMLLGLPTNSGSSFPTAATAFWSQHYNALYFQDDWKTSSKLTLNFGLRWDLEQPVTERHNRYYSRYDPNAPQTAVTNTAQAAYAAGVLGGNGTTNAGIALLQEYRPTAGSFVATGGILYAGLNGTSRSALNPRYKYFQPRIGFAYEVRPNTVLRGGIGRFVQSTFMTSVTNQDGYSVSTPITASNDNYHTIAATLDNPVPNGLLALTGNTKGINTDVSSVTSYYDPNIGRPYTDTASLGIQHQIKNYLIDVGGIYNATHGLLVYDPLNGNLTGNQIDEPSPNAWYAANTPTFAANGQPVATLPGNVKVPNPFLGASYITNGTQTATTISASQLLNPNPLVSSLRLRHGNGSMYYYALNTKVERRFQGGFSIIQAFTWSKTISEINFIGPQAVAEKIEKRLAAVNSTNGTGGDQRFHYTLTPVYELPFGHGKRFGTNSGRALNELIGGFEVTGQYNFLSGTPLVLPTNTAFFEGGNPSLGSRKNHAQWFDTSKFAKFPASNVPSAAVALYPTWTGVQNMPGANYSSTTSNGVYQDFATWHTYNQTTFGNIRNPYLTNIDVGIRKSFAVASTARVQLRMDVFNALNHPLFGGIDTTAGDTYFGYLSGAASPSQSNSPRQVQLSGKITF
jgi:hypothetical protein